MPKVLPLPPLPMLPVPIVPLPFPILEPFPLACLMQVYCCRVTP